VVNITDLFCTLPNGNKRPAKGNKVHDKSRPNEDNQNIDFMSQLDSDTYILTI
jgi:hypothetical protein